MLVSVIVPVYKAEPYIMKCIDSILNQTFKDLEIILVDDGSPDRCGEICDEYAKKDKRIKVIHKKNGGSSSARNAGLAIARGNYIGFVDSDDYIEPDMYENLIDTSLKFKSEVSSVLYRRVDEKGNVKDSTRVDIKNKFLSAEEYLKELLLHIGDVSVCTKLFRKSVIEGLEFEVKKSNEDLLFMLEVIQRIDGIHLITKVGYNYLIRLGSKTNIGFSKTTIDMVDNSIYTLDYVRNKYLNLLKEANRFLLYQHMIYMLIIPKKQMNSNNTHYVVTLHNIRKYIFKNLCNPYISLKEKVILIFMSASPLVVQTIRTIKNS